MGEVYYPNPSCLFKGLPNSLIWPHQSIWEIFFPAGRDPTKVVGSRPVATRPRPHLLVGRDRSRPKPIPPLGGSRPKPIPPPGGSRPVATNANPTTRWVATPTKKDFWWVATG